MTNLTSTIQEAMTAPPELQVLVLQALIEGRFTLLPKADLHVEQSAQYPQRPETLNK